MCSGARYTPSVPDSEPKFVLTVARHYRGRLHPLSHSVKHLTLYYSIIFIIVLLLLHIYFSHFYFNPLLFYYCIIIIIVLYYCTYAMLLYLHCAVSVIGLVAVDSAHE
jgi:hypothetical protein